MSRASSDLLQIQGFVVMIPITASNLMMVATIVVILAVQQPLLALIALAPLPLLNVLATRFSRRIHPAVLAVQAEQAQLATVVEEAVSGVRVVKGFGAEAVTAARLKVEADDIRRVSLQSAKVRSAFLRALDLLPNLGLIAVLAVGGHRVLNGQMTRGEMLEFMQYIGLLIFPLFAPQFMLDLPTLVSIIGALLFLSILTLREATAHLEGEWESVHSLLNVASGLLLMAFFFIVALRFAEFVM